MRTYFLSSQMNAIGGFSVPLSGFPPGHIAKMSSRQKQERRGLCGTHKTTNGENALARDRRPRSATGQRIFKFSADSLPRFMTTSKLTFAPSAKPV